MKIRIALKLLATIGATLLAEGVLTGAGETVVQAMIAVASLLVRAPKDDAAAGKL